jgi:CRISPR-associated protein Cas5d
MPAYPPLAVKVWGEYACFTRPEMKVERVSYPVMTPSAARGVLEAIFWQPEITWQIREIWVLQAIRYLSLLRNEVNHRVALAGTRGWARTGEGYDADDADNRAQRHTLALRDVAYLITADLVLASHATAEHIAKYRDQFRRRVHRGQCYHRPYLGCREFPASFSPPDGRERPIDLTADLGRMLFDLDYRPAHAGRSTPHFFAGRLEHGILCIPPALYRRGT